MTYTLLVTEPLSDRAVAEALAECFRLPVHDVDVADENADQNARNWDAPVLCGMHAVRGDVRTSLDIYAQDSVQPQPSERDLAAALARILGRSVLYPAEPFPPSAYWVAAADGTVTRARLIDPDDETPGYRVDAVEAPVADLPNAQVTRLPEIVREQRKPTPVSGRLATSLDALGACRTDETGSLYWMTVTRLEAWEQLVQTMTDGWTPAGWYPADLYVENLRMRDKVETLQQQLPQQEAELLEAAMEPLDRRFIKMTVPDPAWYLELDRQKGLEVPDEDDIGWWWRRRPEPLPW
ncbi:hypothetical protein [Streptomyces sp. NBC_01477]|uniref:hypothetical protein n=1 Tax=Streptomyces sp. NBC_01477 TaxID=2976015 RepID=UPI002E2FFC02|nr:hypothetical protein [Streptomyces sp. NBC_01477]